MRPPNSVVHVRRKGSWWTVPKLYTNIIDLIGKTDHIMVRKWIKKKKDAERLFSDKPLRNLMECKRKRNKYKKQT